MDSGRSWRDQQIEDLKAEVDTLREALEAAIQHPDEMWFAIWQGGWEEPDFFIHASYESTLMQARKWFKQCGNRADDYSIDIYKIQFPQMSIHHVRSIEEGNENDPG